MAFTFEQRWERAEIIGAAVDNSPPPVASTRKCNLGATWQDFGAVRQVFSECRGVRKCLGF
jgi:hypothetical protein